MKTKNKKIYLTITLFSSIFLTPLITYAQNYVIKDDFWITKKPIYTILIGPYNYLYIGDRLIYVGIYLGSAVPIDINTNQINEPFPRIYGNVYVIIPDNQGGWYIGSKFNKVGNFQRNNLAHILPDGNVDPKFAPNIDGSVISLAIYNSTLYVGGRFTSINGKPRKNLASFNLKDNSLTDFAPNVSSGIFL